MKASEASLPVREGRVFWLDAARALAVISVSFNHALSRSVLLNEAALAKPGLWSYAACLLYVVSRLGVPLFLMISGALLLGRDYTRPGALRRFYTHNWLRLLLATLIWLGIRFWFFLLLNGGGGSLGALLRGFFRDVLMLNGKSIGCMWYMAMILCVYPLIPLLAVAVQRLPWKAFLLPGALVLGFNFLLPNLNAALEAAGQGLRLNSSVEAGYLLPLYLLYLLGGWYLRKGLPKRFDGLLLAVFVVSLGATARFQQWMFAAGTHYTVRYADLGVLLAAAALFALLPRRREARGLPGRLTRSLAVHGLGVYFVHHLLMSALAVLLARRLPNLTGFRAFAVLELAGLGGAWLFVWLTAKLPAVGKYLYLIQKRQ